MAKTRTGGFSIGFRRIGAAWQKDLGNTMAFATANGFECIDVGPLDGPQLKQITAAGLRIGTVDLKMWADLASADAEKRKRAVEANVALVKAAVEAGARSFFTVLIGEDNARKRSEHFALTIQGYGELCRAIAPMGAKIAIEGWPGPSPHYPSLACTPADCRAVLKELPPNAGINFDPSHLIRMGIDPVRFLGEFAARVVHVHGKDTEILEDELYEHGLLQRATFAQPHWCGEHYWRYTIPGHGVARWGKMFAMLRDAGYQGCVSIELEDEDFNGSEEAQKRGFIAGRDFLIHA